jgi:toxin-antitoxin system PIN domain toxin
VILVDANLLIYARVSSMPQHQAARAWLESVLNGPSPVGLPWPSLLAFVRLVTNRRIFERPESIGDAWAQAQEWLACERAWVPAPTELHAEVLGELMPEITGRPELVPDAHLAALAIEHGLILCSADGDFARFSRVRWQNPLAG